MEYLHLIGELERYGILPPFVATVAFILFIAKCVTELAVSRMRLVMPRDAVALCTIARLVRLA